MVAPNEGSLSCVSSGQAATTSGSGPTGEGFIDVAQLVRAVLAITIDRIVTDNRVDPALHSGVSHHDFGNSICSSLVCSFAGIFDCLIDLGLCSQVNGSFMVHTEPEGAGNRSDPQCNNNQYLLDLHESTLTATLVVRRRLS